MVVGLKVYEKTFACQNCCRGRRMVQRSVRRVRRVFVYPPFGGILRRAISRTTMTAFPSGLVTSRKDKCAKIAAGPLCGRNEVVLTSRSARTGQARRSGCNRQASGSAQILINTPPSFHPVAMRIEILNRMQRLAKSFTSFRNFAVI